MRNRMIEREIPMHAAKRDHPVEDVIAILANGLGIQRLEANFGNGQRGLRRLAAAAGAAVIFRRRASPEQVHDAASQISNRTNSATELGDRTSKAVHGMRARHPIGSQCAYAFSTGTAPLNTLSE